MKKVEISAYGVPQEVAACVEAADVGMPGAGEIVFDVLAFPINPADLSMCRGNYRLHPQLPATPGAECVGRITAVGTGVTGLRPGDLVINMQRENWTQRRRIAAADAIPIPAGLDIAQAAMLRINPATAQLLLEDGPDLATRAGDAPGGQPIRLGIDAVSGAATKRIADCVADGGVVVSYGSMSGDDPVMSRAALGARGVTLTGFMLGRGLAKRTPEAVRALYAELAAKLRDGVLKAPIDKMYPIEDIKSALAHAQRGGRHGKVLVLPNGKL